jgi:hypothetical protein
VYLFGDKRAVVTSANLTDAALLTNHEFGFFAEHPLVVQRCIEYFEDFWKRCSRDLMPEWLDEWDAEVAKAKEEQKFRGRFRSLGDRGETIKHPARVRSNLSVQLGETPQAYVKFFGEGGNRAEKSLPVIDEIDRSGSHWACSYPDGKRPSSIRDGDVMFLARMVPEDIMVYGRALAFAHVRGQDDATPADIERRPWKEHWRHYIRIRDRKFVRGTLANGVPLGELMKDLGPDAFASTQRNKARGEGNQDPRHAYRQQAAVRLSAEGAAWMEEHLQQAFKDYGTLTEAELGSLDKPTVPNASKS